MLGLTWFGVYTKSPPLYMAAMAFTAYGVHWFAMGHRRFIERAVKPLVLGMGSDHAVMQRIKDTESSS